MDIEKLSFSIYHYVLQGTLIQFSLIPLSTCKADSIVFTPHVDNDFQRD